MHFKTELPRSTDEVVIPHVTEVIKSLLNYREENVLQVKHLDGRCRIEDIQSMHLSEEISEVLGHMLTDESPNVLDSTVMGALPLMDITGCKRKSDR